MRLADEYRVDPNAIASIPLRTGEGALVPFSQVAKIEMDEGYSFVRREALQRYAVLQMDVKGRDVDSFVKEAGAQIAQRVQLPPGYWVEWGGAFENQQRAMARLAVIVPLTIGLIFILLYTAFNSVTYATLIIANVPFATIGGVVGLFISGQYLSVPSAIGFIAVFGVAMLNGIVLGSILALIVLLWFHNPGLSAVIFVALTCNLLFAAIAGVMVPVTLKRFGYDPALASSIFLTTVTDVMGFFTFLGLATVVLLR